MTGENNGWVDYFQFSSVNAAGDDSWGAIKSLFR
jgi:hypothetical protein